MNKETQIKTILKNILDTNKLNIYIGYKISNTYNNYTEYVVKYHKHHNYENHYYRNNTKYTGVYWLCDGDEVVYIGYSRNLISRIYTHRISSSNKIWDKVKIILIDDTIARSVERTLLLNINTKYNNPKFNEGYTAENRYKEFKNTIKFALKFYNLYITENIHYNELPVGAKNCIDNIQFYKKYADMPFEQYKENFNLKLNGLKHNLLIT